MEYKQIIMLSKLNQYGKKTRRGPVILSNLIPWAWINWKSPCSTKCPSRDYLIWADRDLLCVLIACTMRQVGCNLTDPAHIIKPFTRFSMTFTDEDILLCISLQIDPNISKCNFKTFYVLWWPQKFIRSTKNAGVFKLQLLHRKCTCKHINIKCRWTWQEMVIY